MQFIQKAKLPFALGSCKKQPLVLKSPPIQLYTAIGVRRKLNPQAATLLSHSRLPSLIVFLHFLKIPCWHWVISSHTVNNGLQILTKQTAEMIIHPSTRLLCERKAVHSAFHDTVPCVFSAQSSVLQTVTMVFDTGKIKFRLEWQTCVAF